MTGWEVQVSDPLVLAIDAGNSGCRAAVVRPDGEIVSIAAREWARAPASADPTMIEIDLQGEWSAIAETIAEAVGGAASEPIVSIGVSAARSGLVVLDASATPIAAFGPLDGRALPIARERVAAEAGWPARLRSHTGQSTVVAAGPRLGWLRDREARVLDGATVLTLSGWLVHQLTGETVAEATNASTIGLLDLATRSWWEEEQRRWQIPSTILPPVSPPDAFAGALRPKPAAAAGLRAGIPVTVGGGDTQLALLALGATARGTVAVVAGSFWQIARVVDAPTTDPIGRLRTTAHLAPDRWLLEARIGAPGLAARWLRDTLVAPGAADGYDRLITAADAVPVGSGGVVALLAPDGGNAAGAPVTFHDLSGRATPNPAVAFRALLESTATQVVEEIQDLDRIAPGAGGPIAVGGGAVRNRLWLQILADALGRSIRPSAMADQSLVGAAIVAAAAAGIHPSVEAASQAMQRWATAIEPDPAVSEAYEEIATRAASGERARARGRQF